ncbi:hypothetical protein [Haloplanus halophilus]|uniref:hypothetical protein n=1 Tax=Haloplanus halophilus TaxID=2949993 RepID=UPI0020414E28|nr:hypothetical protein [Haloplanus sp. GDY1]
MHRRAVLALCGSGLAGLAGCSSRRESDAPTGGTTATPTPTASDAELAVELDALGPALVELDTDHYELVSGGDRQYLVLAVSVASGTAPSRSALSFRFDGTEYAPRTWDRIPARQSEGGDQYAAENGAGWVAFELPATGDAGDAALVWPGGEWRPDETLRARLAAASPPLSMTGWTVPETVPLDGRSTFEVTVRNEGEHAGRFVGAINATGWLPHRPVTVVSRRVAPGDSESWTVGGEELTLVEESLSESVGDGDPDVTYELVWTGGSREGRVRVVGAD